MKVSKINDPRLVNYTDRLRSGSTQVFRTGGVERDFDRYRKEMKERRAAGETNPQVEMHDKPDTIRLEPPEQHYYADLIDGEWWWINGCSECCGGERDSWKSYIECDKHNVCRTCKTPHHDITETPWGGKNGWQCKPCYEPEAEDLKAERLKAFDEAGYSESDFYYNDKVVCPHCASEYEPDSPDEWSGEQVCEVCDGEFTVEVEYSVSYSTTRKKDD